AIVGASVAEVPARRGRGPIKEDIDPGLVEALLDASPLTSTLREPSERRRRAGTVSSEVATALAMLSRPQGRLVLPSVLSEVSRGVPGLGGRAPLLRRRLGEHADVVLDVSSAARLLHGPQWDQALAAATRELRGPGATPELALALVQYWVP